MAKQFQERQEGSGPDLASVLAGTNGIEAATARSGIVDELVAELFEDSALAGVSPVAVLAVGGYGRQQLFPHSDIDLLFLFPKETDTEKYQGPISEFVTKLWDEQLRVSQSVRTLGECTRLAPDNAELHISLLDPRLLAGNNELYGEFSTQRLPSFYLREQKSLMKQLVDLSKSRHESHADTIYHLEPDVKEAPGGLRDLQLAGWLGQLAGMSRERIPLPVEGIPEELRARTAEAQSYLFTLRTALHLVHGRDNNRLTFEAQETLAAEELPQLGAADGDRAPLMRSYFQHARAIRRVAVRQIEEAYAPDSRLFSLFRGRQARLSNHDFSVANGRVYFRDSRAGQEKPELAFEVFAFLARHGLTLSARAEARLRESAETIRSYGEANGVAGWRVLREVLLSKHAYNALAAMNSSKVLGAVMPEWRGIDCLVLADFYHRYTVDEHTLLTIRNLSQLENSETDDDRGFRGMRAELHRPELLGLALLLHDVGKGTPGPGHEQRSSEMARSALERFELPLADREFVLFLIENHLVMSEFIRTRDLSDQTTAREMARWTGTEQRLKALTLLTFADIGAVNPEALTPWRKRLLWRLYISTYNALHRDFEDERLEPETVSAALDLAKDAEERAALQQFVEGFPKRYLRTHSAEEIVGHYRLSRELDERPVALAAVHASTEHTAALTWVARDRPFLFASLCAAISSYGLSVEKAEAFANAEGIVLDMFTVNDPHRVLDSNPGEIRRLRRQARRILDGEVDPRQLLTARQERFSFRTRRHLAPSVSFDNETSDRATIFHVIAEDRRGLLFDVATQISEADCDIEIVLIETQGGKAIDVFYVVGAEGKLDDETAEQLQALLSRVCRASRLTA